MTSAEIDARIRFMLELANCNYTLYYTVFDSEMNLLSTTCPADVTLPNSVLQHVLKSFVLDYVGEFPHAPICLDASINITWMLEGEYEGGVLNRLHVVGPVYYQRVSSRYLLSALDKHSLSVPLRSRFITQIGQLPVIPSMVFNGYGQQLHYCITGEHIGREAITFITAGNGKARRVEDYTDFSTEHSGVWAAEQELLKAIRDGSPDYKQMIYHSASLSTGVKMQDVEPLRRHKNNIITLLTLVSRAAIEGGLNPSVSYNLNDRYMTEIESCTNIAELSVLSDAMLDDFVSRVHQAKSAGAGGISKQIQNSCDYINMHLNEDLSIADLANRFGYTEYYFSHKFKKETGSSVRDYIKRQKLERAKVLLSTTSDSIQEICDALSFGSRSFFSVAFREAYGISPSEYRSKNSKI